MKRTGMEHWVYTTKGMSYRSKVAAQKQADRLWVHDAFVRKIKEREYIVVWREYSGAWIPIFEQTVT